MFGSIGGTELLVILFLVLIIFGPKRLPEFGRTIGKGLAEFKRASNDLRRSLEEEVRIDDIQSRAQPREETRVEDTEGRARPEEEARVEDIQSRAQPEEAAARIDETRSRARPEDDEAD